MFTLKFTNYAWQKLNWFCDYADTEIGGFGISSAKDPLLIEDFITVKQKNTIVTVEFDDTAVADFFENMVDEGRQPNEFARIWIHTHPGNSASPSVKDEETFKKAFGKCDWAIMFILAREGETYCRMRFSYPVAGSMEIPVEVIPDEIYQEEWLQEFKNNVEEEKVQIKRAGYKTGLTYANSPLEEMDQTYTMTEQEDRIPLSDFMEPSTVDEEELRLFGLSEEEIHDIVNSKDPMAKLGNIFI